MKKVFNWISNNILFLITLFLLVFIPLYPKKPLVDVVNTWVYVRLEDFIVVAVMAIWTVLLIRKKVTLKTPLTMPILLFWIVGALSTIHGILLIFPTIANVFPNVAFLSFLRRIEYLSLFFVAFSGMRDKRMLPYVAVILVAVLFAVIFYGVGQRYAGFPAYLTMNEEFAKGEAIHLSPLSRVPSTFAGHYDLAAYLVFILPFVASLIFGVRKWILRIILIGAIGAGLVLLEWTVSRVSFFVLLVSLIIVFLYHKRKWVIFSLPIVAILATVIFVNFAPRLLDRFTSTVKEINVLVDANTGAALGNIEDISRNDLEGKTVRSLVFQNTQGVEATLSGKSASIAAIVPFEKLPATGVLLVPPNESTGENLPQGTGYINLPLSPVREQRGEFFYQNKLPNAASSSDIKMFTGKFLVKKALAYDLSFTTRFQGEWPHAIDAFKRNIFFGSGYGSISLAIDNSYLRMLGETGLLGTITFLIIFVTIGAYIVQLLPKVESRFTRSFIVGFAAGTVGLILNATLIDVFEASKVAFYLWVLTGITVGILYHYQTKPFVFYQTIKKVGSSTYAIVFYLLVLVFFMYSSMLSNYFVADDFTWFRWVAEGGTGPTQLAHYFTHADGFFYRPGTKLLFALLYPTFWLNPVVYHVVSLVVHSIVVLLVFFLSKKILRNFKVAVLASFLFVMLSSYHEAVFWISSVGHLFSGMFVLFSLLFFMLWDEKKRFMYFIASILSIAAGLLFHELVVIAPLLLIFYKFTNDGFTFATIKRRKIYYALLFSPVVIYLIVRFFAQSHWAGGDYTYNLFKLPFNFIGNSLGYLLLSTFGPITLPFYEALRHVFRGNLLITSLISIVVLACLFPLYKIIKRMKNEDKRIVIFSIGFILIVLLPFLGLGNITSRYTYLASVGVVILFAFAINKLYGYLLHNGRDVAIGVVTLFLSIFFLLHIMQMQQLQGDWNGAGVKVNRFFVGIQGAYSNYWSDEPMQLTFVNVPVHNGQAWVFPVGMQDALWLMFKTSTISIHQSGSLQEAVDAVTNIRNQKVFLFDDGGNITEKRKLKNGKIVTIDNAGNVVSSDATDSENE